VAAATVAVAPDPDEADTLHPEDGVALPLLDEPPAPPPADEEPGVDGDTMIVSTTDLFALARAAATPAQDGEPSAPLWRKFVALVVMVLLVAAIVLLVTRGLAR
jgi:hypothetical protein